MTRARRELISLTDTPYYHCIARCVRRSFLCGLDSYSNKDYSHRRNWVVARMQTLSTMFAIDVCAYAIMSNHYHLVLKVDVQRANAWTFLEVIAHWNILFGLPDLVSRFQAGMLSNKAEVAKATEIIERWRTRLADISWYMRCLNEHIARLANAEDTCTGRFWEGRFKSQSLLDEQALLTCMAYVDLNPVRAQIAATPETSDFTSVQQRIQGVTTPRYPLARPTDVDTEMGPTGCPLLAFIGGTNSDTGIPFRCDDYLALVDWSGRIIRADKSGVMAADTPPLLQRLGIDETEFLKHVSPTVGPRTDLHHRTGFYVAIGSTEKLRAMATLLGKKFLKGLGKAQRLFPSPPFA